MCKFNKIEYTARESGGIFLSSDCEKCGISRTSLSSYARQGKLERIRRGVYLLPDYFEDEMFALQASVPGAVYSHNTALHLQGHSDRTPLILEVTVPDNYNGTNLRKRGVQVHRAPGGSHGIGITEVKTMYGNMVRVYEIERTLCDILKPKARIDIGIITDAFKQYARQKNKDMAKLSKYAKMLGVEQKVRSYMEVLL